MSRTPALLLLAALALSAQPVRYDEPRKVWLLTTRHNSYALGLGADGALRHLYWGAPLWRAEDLAAPAARRDLSSFDPRQMLEAEEYPGWGGPRYYEPALKITRDDGVRDLVLRYVSHRMQGDDLDIVLKDINDPIEVTLHYHVYAADGILRRNATIRNATPIHEGQKVLESRKGNTSHNFNPWFAIDAGDAGEEHGRVWFGALGWSAKPFGATPTLAPFLRSPNYDET